MVKMNVGNSLVFGSPGGVVTAPLIRLTLADVLRSVCTAAVIWREGVESLATGQSPTSRILAVSRG